MFFSVKVLNQRLKIYGTLYVRSNSVEEAVKEAATKLKTLCKEVKQPVSTWELDTVRPISEGSYRHKKRLCFQSSLKMIGCEKCSKSLKNPKEI